MGFFGLKMYQLATLLPAREKTIGKLWHCLLPSLIT
jgi:hypothetical protein